MWRHSSVCVIADNMELSLLSDTMVELIAYARLSVVVINLVHDIGRHTHRARQLYKNISMLFLFPVKDGKLSIGVNATFDASCYG